VETAGEPIPRLAATLSVREAAARRWDVIVVGAGPAGSTAARALAVRGLAVLLLDRAAFPRTKVCGCCVNGAGLGALQRCGLGGLPQQLGAIPLREFVLAVGVPGLAVAARGSTLRLPLPGGFALSRAAFDTALVRAAIAAGAHFRPGVRAALVPAAGPARTVHCTEDEEEFIAGAACIVAADGLGGRFLRHEPEFEPRIAPTSRVGLGVVAPFGPEDYLPGVIYMACTAGGYAGVVRIEHGRLNIAAAVDPARIRQAGGAGHAVAGILSAAGLPGFTELDRLRWQGTGLLTRRCSRLAGQRLFVVGDAAGYIEPFTGEGIAWALESGLAVAPLVERAVADWSPGLAGEWTARYRSLLGSRQRWCRGITAVLRKPRLTRLACAALGLLPQLATPYLRRLNGAGA